MNKYLYGVRIHDMTLVYYIFDSKLSLNTQVIVEDPSLGLSIGIIESIKEIDEVDTESFPKIFRAAIDDDKKLAQYVKKQEQEAFKYVSKTVDEFGLDMKVLRCFFALDSSKLLIIYSSDDRVDFREIVKDFAKKFKTHIEMRQIGSRDRAQLIGGIGVCGLKLCCSSFLKTFDVISINMAKNQLLSLNIPKLSGQCGKLICCLKYEDESYSELRKVSPRIGDKYIIDKKEYKITGINLLTGMTTLSYNDEFINLDKKELQKYKNERK